MRRHTKFEIMRLNRERRPPVMDLIEAIEKEVDQQWAQERERLLEERRAQFGDTAGWLNDTRRQLRLQQEPRRRWWQFWCWRWRFAWA